MDTTLAISIVLMVVAFIVLALIARAVWQQTRDSADNNTGSQSTGDSDQEPNNSSSRGIGMKSWAGVMPDGYTGAPMLLNRTTRFFGNGEVTRIVNKNGEATKVQVKVKVRDLKNRSPSDLTSEELDVLFRKPADGIYIRVPFTKVVPVRTQEEAILIADPEDRSQSRTPIARLTDKDGQTFYVGYNLFWKVSSRHVGLAFKTQMNFADVGSDEALLERIRQTVASRGEDVIALLSDRHPDDIKANIDQIFEDELKPQLSADVGNIGVELIQLSRASLYWSPGGEDNMMQPARARRDVEANQVIGRGRPGVRNSHRPAALDDVIPGWRKLYGLNDDSDEAEVERVALECYELLSPDDQKETRAEMKAALDQESMKQFGSD